VSVDKERVLDVPRDNCQFVNINVINIVDDVDASALRRIGWFHNPHIPLGLHSLQFRVVRVEVAEFIRQNIGVRHEIEGCSSELLLHLVKVVSHSVLASDLVGLGEMVNSLVFV